MANPMPMHKSIREDSPGNLKFKKKTRKEKREYRKDSINIVKLLIHLWLIRSIISGYFPALIVFQNAGLIKRLKYTVLVILE